MNNWNKLCKWAGVEPSKPTADKILALEEMITKKHFFDFGTSESGFMGVYKYGYGVTDLHLQCYGKTRSEALTSLIMKIDWTDEEKHQIKRILEE
jgi:hypothetical protein